MKGIDPEGTARDAERARRRPVARALRSTPPRAGPERPGRGTRATGTGGAVRLPMRLLGAALLLGVAGAACGKQPSLIGTWEWTRKSNACREQYVFRGDGVVSVRSGERHTESTFLMAWAPEPTGRFRLTMTMARAAGGRDCGNAPADAAGGQQVVYILFGQSHETMILCTTPAGADCIGPLRRTAP